MRLSIQQSRGTADAGWLGCVDEHAEALGRRGRLGNVCVVTGGCRVSE
jgi:hypothetical protein